MCTVQMENRSLENVSSWLSKNYRFVNNRPHHCILTSWFGNYSFKGILLFRSDRAWMRGWCAKLASHFHRLTRCIYKLNESSCTYVVINVYFYP